MTNNERNSVLEEAARRIELCAGEGLQDGKTFHYCAEKVRELKREEQKESGIEEVTYEIQTGRN